jgi:hypothetical protein
MEVFKKPKRDTDRMFLLIASDEAGRDGIPTGAEDVDNKAP